MICKTIVILLISSSVFCAPTEVPEQDGQAYKSRGVIQFGCPRSQYSCKASVFQKNVCIGLEKLCDGTNDCPSGEDESNSLCSQKGLIEELKKTSKDGIENDFAGTGFMFSVGNIVVSKGSKLKMFNQNSDNVADPNSLQMIISNGQQQN